MSHLRLRCPESQERKVWEVPNKGSGERSAPASAAAAPAGPAALRLPATKSRLPSCVPPRKKAPLGKERKKLSVYANAAPVGRAPGRPGAPRRLRAPPASGSAPPEATSGQEQPSPTPPPPPHPIPHRTPRPGKARELGNERLTPHSRLPEGGTGRNSFKAIVLSSSLYAHTYKNIHELYISLHYLSFSAGYDTFYCINYLKNILRYKNKSKTQAELQCPYVKNLFISNCA